MSPRDELLKKAAAAKIYLDLAISSMVCVLLLYVLGRILFEFLIGK
ncbi:hypothetical protein J5N58_01280 [Rhizobium cremeum]|nr:hypothetical protein [Rhizobium cremeum]MCJ7993229.1 hypothetical protein [Rhizobium cremeum]MCJ7998294.1 hypothetical protein [Rhizobium cremeum]